jgi:hypothetical protein
VTRKRTPQPLASGVAVVAFVAALLIMGTFVLWLFSLTASMNLASLGHLQGMGAFYAAEGGLELSSRELTREPPADIDSDGTIGTISDNDNPGDDPASTTGAAYVKAQGTVPETYRAYGRPTQATSFWSGFCRTAETRRR